MTEDEMALWAGVSPSATLYSSIVIRNTHYRSESCEQNLSTCDSGVSATFQMHDGRNKVAFGIIQQVMVVNACGKSEVLLHVKWYKEAIACPTLRGTWWIRTGGRYPFVGAADSIIAAAKIDGQVFFAPDPDKTGYSNVFAYRSSSYIVPEHHCSPDGRLLDLDFLDPASTL
jgi:hypothetical protein